VVLNSDELSINSASTASVAENQTAALTVTSSDEGGGAPTYTISGGADSALFSIDPASGDLTFTTAPDFENPMDADGDNVYEVVVEAADSNGVTDTQVISLTVTDINETQSTNNIVVVEENQSIVQSVTSSFANGGSPMYTIVGGTDASMFDIDPASGEMTFIAPPDFENPGDSSANNSYDVIIQVSDDTGRTDTQFTTVTVTNVNEAPILSSLETAGSSILANSGLSGALGTPSFTEHVIDDSTFNAATSVTTTDIDGDGDLDVVATYTFSDDVVWYENDGTGNFVATHFINPNANGAQSAAAADLDGDGDMDVLSASNNDNSLIWYENDGNQNFTQIIITSNYDAFDVTTADLDGDGDLDVLSANRISDNVIWFENDGNQNFTTHFIDNNANGVQSVDVADIDSDGDLDVLAASSFDNQIVWFENDGSQQFTKHIVASNVDDVQSVSAADIDADGDIDLVSASNGDNTIAWFTNDGNQNFSKQIITNTAFGAESVSVADLDGDGDIDVLSAAFVADTVAWYENDGSGSFTDHAIDTSAAGAQDVTTGDIDGDGVLDVVAAALAADDVIWYENDAVSSGPQSANPIFVEDGPAVVLDSDVEVVDPELSASNDFSGATLSIGRDGGFNADDVFGFNDGNGITLVGSDLVKNGSVIATFDNVSVPGRLLIFFTGAAGETPTNADVNAVMQQLTYSNVNDTPPASVDLTWLFNDGNTAGAQGPGGPLNVVGSTTVTIIAENDDPVISSPTTASVAENQTAVFSVSSVDADGGVPIYSIEGGADGASFTIDPVTGDLAFAPSPDFENPADVDGDNVYDVIVGVADGNGGMDTQAITVTVTNINGVPTLAFAPNISVSENQTVVQTLSGFDQDGDTLVYSITGGADSALFSIDPATGELSFIAAPDFENPTDANGDNVYNVTVQVSDGNGVAPSGDIAVTVTNVNEDPAISSLSVQFLAENTTDVGVVTSIDVDGGIPDYSIVGGPDAALFTIDNSSGDIQFIVAPDHENPNDADGDGVYNIEVEVSDGNGGAGRQEMQVIVFDSNDAPVISAQTFAFITENETISLPVSSSDDDGDIPTYSIVSGADSGLFSINSRYFVYSP